MSLNSSQTIITVKVKARKYEEVPQKLTQALEPYPNARIVTLSQTLARAGTISVLAVIEYTPGGQDE